MVTRRVSEGEAKIEFTLANALGFHCFLLPAHGKRKVSSIGLEPKRLILLRPCFEKITALKRERAQPEYKSEANGPQTSETLPADPTD